MTTTDTDSNEIHMSSHLSHDVLQNLLDGERHASARVQHLVQLALKCKNVDRSLDHTSHDVENKLVMRAGVLHRN